MDEENAIADAISEIGDDSNLVTMLGNLADNSSAVANAITPLGAGAGQDASGGIILSLTEAVMGITSGLHEIAGALNGIAEAIGYHNDLARSEGE